MGNQIRGGRGAPLTALAVAGVLLIGASHSAAAPPSNTCTGQAVAITPANAAAAERSLLCLVNVYRQDNGLDVVTRDSSLESAARSHSEDMVTRGYFDHASPEGAFHDQRALAAGYPADTVSTSENLAADFPEGSPFSLFDSWRTSTAGHNENMLDRKWATSGFGVVRGWPGDETTDATFDEGATATSLFGAEDRAGIDTAADLVGGDPNAIAGAGPGDGSGDGDPSACEDEKATLQAAKRKLAKAKKAKAKAQARERAAPSPVRRRMAARTLRSRQRALKQAKRASTRERKRYLACLDGL